MGVNAGSITFTLDEAGTAAEIGKIVGIAEAAVAKIKPIKLKFEADSGDPVKMLSEIRSLVEEISKKNMQMNLSLSASNKSSSSSLKAYKEQITQVSSAIVREFSVINNAASNIDVGGKWGAEAKKVEDFKQRVRDLNTELTNAIFGNGFNAGEYGKTGANGILDASGLSGLSSAELQKRGEAIGDLALKIRSLYEEINAATGKDVANLDGLFKPEKAATSLESAEKIAAALASSVSPAQEIGTAMEKVSTAGLPAEQFEAIVAPLQNINNILSSLPGAASAAQAALAGVGEAGEKSAGEIEAAEAKVSTSTKELSSHIQSWKTAMNEGITSNNLDTQISKYVNTLRKLQDSFVKSGGSKDNDAYKAISKEIENLLAVQAKLRDIKGTNEAHGTTNLIAKDEISEIQARATSAVNSIENLIAKTKELKKAQQDSERDSDRATRAKTKTDNRVRELEQEKKALEGLSKSYLARGGDASKLPDVNKIVAEITDAQNKLRSMSNEASAEQLFSGMKNSANDAIGAIKNLITAQKELEKAQAQDKRDQAKQAKEQAAYEADREKMLRETLRRQQELESLKNTTVIPKSQDANNIDVAIEKYKQLAKAISDSNSGAATKSGNAAFKAELDGINESVSSTIENLERMKAAEQTLNSARLGLDNIERLQAKFLKAGGSRDSADFMNMEHIRQQYAALVSEINDAAKAGKEFTKTDIEGFSSKLANLNTQAKLASSNFRTMKDQGMGFGTQFKQALTSQLSFTFGIQAMARNAIRYTREMVNSAIELDSAMTQLKIVTNESDAAYQSYARSLSGTAQEVGSSIADLTDSATVYARLGYNLDESAQLSKFTAMLRNVGNIDVSSAQNAMTAIVKAFNIGVDGVETAMDKMVAVGNNAPISVAEIAEGMNNAGSALQAAGNSFDESVALLTAANTTVQNISKSSTGLRTISARIRKMDTDLNDLGETMTEADYQAMVSALTDASVSLVDSNGQLRSTYDILSDIAAVWERLSANEKAALAETLSGTRQQNVFFSIIEQFQEAQKAMELMGNSEGTLTRANDKYMQSVQAHINQFKAAFQGIASEVFTADLMNSFIDIGTAILNIFRSLATVLAPVGEGIALITDLVGSLAGAIADLSSGMSNIQSTFMSAVAMILGAVSGNWIVAIIGLLGVLGGLKTEFESVGDQYEAQVQHVAKLRSQYEQLTGEASEYQSLLKKQKELEADGRNLTQSDQRRLQQLEAEAAALEKTLNEAEAIERTKWFEKMNQKTTTDMGQSGVTVAQNDLMMMKRAVYNLNEQWKSGEGSAEDYLSTLNNVIATYSDLYTQYKKYQGTDGWTPEMESFVQYYETLLDGRKAILDAEARDNKALVNKPKQYKHVEEAIKSATAALEKFNEASKEDNSETANSYAEAYKKFQADWKAGKIGSNTVKAAIDLFIPDDVQSKLGYDTQKLGELLNSNIYKSVFKGDDASKYGKNLIEYIKSNASKFDGVINLSKDDKGYSVEYSSLQNLANAFGVTTEAAAALISMLQDYSDILIMSKQDTIMLADNLGLLGSKGVSGFTKISEIANKLATLDPSIGTSGIVDTLKSLEEAGYVDLSGVENTLGAIAKNAIAVRDAEQSAAENPPDIEISTNSEAVISAIDGVVAALGEIPQNVNVVISVSYSEDIAEEAEAITTAEQTVEENAPNIEANINSAEVISNIGGITNALNSIPTNIEVSVHTTYTESGTPPSMASKASGTRNFAGGKTLVNELGPELIAENGRAYIAGGGQPTVVDLSPGAIVLTANETKKALKGGRKDSFIGSAASGKTPYRPSDVQATASSFLDAIQEATKKIADKQFNESVQSKGAAKLSPGTTTDDYLAYLAAKDSGRNPAPKPPTTSTGGSGDWYGGGGGGGEDPNKRKKGWFEEELKEHKHLVEMEQETQEDYLKWLDEAYKLAYEDKEFELDDYRKYEEEVYKGLQDLFKDYISDREFEIEVLERAGDKAEEIGVIYQNLIAEIEAKIQEAYDYGLTDNDDYVQQLYKELWGFKDKVSDLEEDSLDDSQKATEKLIKYRMKMIKKELEDEKKSYEERLKTLNEFIDKQKQMLRDDAAQEDYLDEQAEKRKKVTDLQLQLNALEFDDSAKAQKKKLQLQEQLADAQKELDKFERDHAIDMTEKELDHISELAEESTKKQTEAIDEKLDNQQYLYEKALQDIINNNRTLYEDMIAYEKKFGEGHEAPVVQMWEEAYVALKNYAGLYGELYKGIDLQNFTGYNGTPTVRGYASGTRNAAAGLHRLFENGDEYVFTSSNGSTYRMFSGGEKVLNAQASNFLYDFANTRGGILSNLINGIGKSIGHITSSTNEPVNIVMGDININGSASEETVSQIRREQKAGVRYMLEELKKLKR